MKNILLISGGNRKGNTQSILEIIDKNRQNTQMLLLKDKNIEYCKGCLACHKMIDCVIKDDMKEIIEKMIASDLIIFGVPNYFDNVSGLFKNFMDRLHPLYKSGLLANKKVIFIYVGGGNENGTKEELHHSIRGFVKYLKLNVIKEYSFQALNYNDILSQQEKIHKVVSEMSENL